MDTVVEDHRKTLLADLRRATRTLHTEAERSGMVREMLRGSISRFEYAHILHNLYPVYAQMERAVSEPAVRETLGPLAETAANPAIHRAAALLTDLRNIAGERLQGQQPTQWSQDWPLQAATSDYVARIADIARTDPVRIVGHLYTRYLGDLSGGRILQGVIQRSLALPDEALAFYQYPGIANLDDYKQCFLVALHEFPCSSGISRRIADEATVAFRFNIRLSNEIYVAMRGATRTVMPAG